MSSDPTTTLQVNGATYIGKELPSSRARYFESLATPTDAAYDSEFKQSIESEYCELLNQPLDSFTPFAGKEVVEALQSLKLNKAAEPDEIDPGHLLYGGDALVSHLTSLLNAIVSSGHNHAIFQSGLLLPIPKSNKRCRPDFLPHCISN